jgi:hypothetical protein
MAPRSRIACQRAGLVQPPVAIADQRVGDLGGPEVQEGKDEKFVPEHVAAVRLAVEAARRHVDVKIDAVARDRLQEMEDMEPEDSLIAALVREHDVAATPKLIPGEGVAAKKFGEVGHPPHQREGLGQRLADGAIARGVQGDNFLDTDRNTFFHVNREILAGVARPGARGPARFHRLVEAKDAGSGGLRHLHAGLAGAGENEDPVAVGAARFERFEMPARKAAIARDAIVHDRSVEGGAHRQPSRPVARGHHPFDRRQVRLGHADEPPVDEVGFAPLSVAKPDRALQQAFLQVQLLNVSEDVELAEVEPLIFLDPQAERQPVRQVHEIFVLDLSIRDPGRESVVTPGDVRAWVMDGVGRRPLGGATDAEIAVPEGAKRLAKTLVMGIEAFVFQPPRRHGGMLRSRSAAGRRRIGASLCAASLKNTESRHDSRPDCGRPESLNSDPPIP